MRDPRRKSAKCVRRRRWAILAVVFMAGSSVVMAEGPGHPTLDHMPPLPLTSDADTHQVQENPFYGATLNDSTVKLASSGKGTSIRLKPIGAAIGLQSIEGSQPKTAEKPAMTIEAVSPSVVRSNPLFESVYDNKDGLVDAEVDNAAPPAKAAKPRQSDPPAKAGSTIILVPSTPVPPLQCEHAPVVSVPTAPPLEVEPVATIQPYMAKQPEVTSGPAEPAASGFCKEASPEMDPIFFSLSDNAEPTDASATCQGNQMDETAPGQGTDQTDALDGSEGILSAAAASGADDKLQQPGDDAAGGALDSSARVSGAAPVELDVVEPIVLEDPRLEFLEPIEAVIDDESSAPVAIYESQHAVAGPVETPEATLHTKRYRPPVAVKAVPLAFERTPKSSPSDDRPTVQRVQAMNLGGPGLAATPNAELTPLYMSRAQVRSLIVGGQVRGVKVADESVCQAVASGPNQLKLIGTGNGVTQLVVWAAAGDADTPIRMRAFEVHVKEALGATGNEIGSKAAMLNQSIRNAFPRCSVEVRPQRDRLVVIGRCDSETSAKKIIRMVRKTCLVPVQDKLVVR